MHPPLKLPSAMVLLALGLVLAPQARSSPFYSIDAASPSVPGVSNNDVLAPGPVGGPPTLVVPSAALGLLPGAPDELDAFSVASPVDLGAIFFSVDRAATGLPGGAPDVFSEAAAGQAAGDVFVSTAPGSNTLAFNQDILGLVPATPPGAASAGPIDDIDALDLVGPVGPGVGIFSLATGNAGGFSGADLLLTPAGGGPPSLFATAIALGLVVSDDIDALHLDSLTGDCLFSLVAGSPSLAGLGAGPGDILVSPGCGAGPAPSVLAPALSLGLAAGDDLDALTFIPEPASAGLLALGLVALSAGRRRKEGSR